MLDVKTVLFSYIVTSILITFFMALLWYRNRRRYAGLDLWLAGFTLQTLVMVLLLLREVTLAFISIVIGNGLLVFGLIFLLMGLEHFVGRRRRQIHNYLLLAVVVLSLSYFLLIRPDISIRSILLSAAVALVTGQSAWLLLYRVDGRLKSITRSVGLVLLLFALVSLARVVTLLLLPLPAASRYFQSPLLQVLFLVGYQMLSIALTFALILMVSRRLQMDLQLQETRQQAFLKNFQGIAFQMTGQNDPPLMFAGRVRELTGYEPDDFLSGRVAWEQLIHPDDRPSVRAQHEQALRIPGNPVRAEYRFRRLDGSIRWVGEVGEGLPPAGQTPVFQGAIQDITDRKQAEQVLKESEAKYRRLYDSLMDAYFSVDMTGRIVEFNQAYESLLGYSKEELLRLTYVDLTPERWHSIESDLVENQILARGYSDIYEKDYRRKDGAIIPVELRTFLIRDVDGRPEGMWTIVRDISKRKEVVEALRRAEEKYSLAFQASPDWCAITTMDEGVFVEVNKAFERLSGLGREEVLGKSALKLGIWDRPEERLRLVDLMRRQGTVHNMEVRFRLGSGEVGTFMLSAEMIELEGRPLMLKAARDMTEFRSLEAQLRQAQKMEAVGRLAGGVAHDFNNMLGVILGYTDLALRRLNAQEPLYYDLQEVNNAARRSADLTRQLLAFSRKQVTTPRVMNLNEAVSLQQKMLGRLIGEDIDLKFIPGPDLWNVCLDSSQVDQILANLAVNARDAIAGVGTVTMETANVTLDENYTRRYPHTPPGEYVMLAVTDSGHGMDRETLERIFEPFFTTKMEGQGTGLGLSTVYGIVKQNQGSIQAYSEPDRGTTIKIYIPRFLGEAVSVKPVKETPLSGSETVLIVEDEPQILLLAKRILEQHGYKTMAAGSPGEALLLLEKHRGPLDLLLTDVIMPTMTGPDLRARVDALHPQIKTLFMSGYTAEVITQRGLLEEGTGFIQKPFSVQELAARVREVLDE